MMFQKIVVTLLLRILEAVLDVRYIVSDSKSYRNDKEHKAILMADKYLERTKDMD